LYVRAASFRYTITLSPIESTPPAGDHGFDCLELAGGFLLRRLNMGGQHGAGKGDKYRKVDREAYSKNYEAIFGKKKGKKTNGKDSTTDKRRRDSRNGD